MSALPFPDPPLAARGLRLRPFREADIPVIVATLREPETVRFMPNLKRDYTEADARDWLASHEPARTAGHGLAFAIADAESDALLGSVSVKADQTNETAVLAYLLTPAARGKGNMTTAVRLVSAWLFDILAMKRVELTTDPQNTASQAVAQRVGFQREGLIRQHLKDPDTHARLDSILWGLLPSELVQEKRE